MLLSTNCDSLIKILEDYESLKYNVQGERIIW